MEFERWKEIQKLKMDAKKEIKSKQEDIAGLISEIERLEQEERNLSDFKDWVHRKWDKGEIKKPKPYCENECKHYRPIMCLIKEPITSIGRNGHKLVIDGLLQCGNVYECDKYDGLSDYRKGERL